MTAADRASIRQWTAERWTFARMALWLGCSTLDVMLQTDAWLCGPPRRRVTLPLDWPQP